VAQLDDGPAVVVDEPGGIIRAGDPESPDPVDSSVPGVVGVSSDPGSSPIVAGLSGVSWPGVGALGFATMSLLSGVSLALSLLRRQHARRRLAARIEVRLAAFGAPSDQAPGPRSPERGGSTIHSA
jgi:hypothetical protein